MKTIIQASSQHMKHETGIINQQDKHNNQNMKYKTGHELLKQKVIVNHMISMIKTCALDL